MTTNKTPFYNSTLKRLITIFGSVFNEIYFESDFGEDKKVPLFFSQREKFLVDRAELGDIYRMGMEAPYPRMGFEVMDMNYAPERMVNPMHKIRGKDATHVWQHNRVPYDFSFNLYVATKTLETGFKIVEQIIPMFAPSFNVTVNEVDGFDTKTDLSIVFNSISQDVDYVGAAGEPRTIVWTLNFTMKAYLYNRTNMQTVIKETITKMSTSELDQQFVKYTSAVVPRSADKSQPHTIVDKIEEGLK